MKITLDCFHFKFYKDVSSRELPFTDLIKTTRLCSQKEESNDIISTMELQHVTIAVMVPWRPSGPTFIRIQAQSFSTEASISYIP